MIGEPIVSVMLEKRLRRGLNGKYNSLLHPNSHTNGSLLRILNFQILILFLCLMIQSTACGF